MALVEWNLSDGAPLSCRQHSGMLYMHPTDETPCNTVGCEGLTRAMHPTVPQLSLTLRLPFLPFECVSSSLFSLPSHQRGDGAVG